MKKIILTFALLAFGVSVSHALVDVQTRYGEGPRLVLSGEFLGMYTFGFASDDQVLGLPETPLGQMQAPHGIFDNENNGRNGHITRMDFSMMLSPVSWADLFVQFRARSRVGNPYIPLMLGADSADDFNLSFENAWGRVNLINSLGLEMPLDVFIQAGLFSTAPASFQRVTRFDTENVMSRLRLASDPALQLEGVFRGLEFAESASLTIASSQRFNEAITPIFDGDGVGGLHGEATAEEIYALPLFVAARIRNIATPVGGLSAELVYALNADGIFSGHNFGANARFDLALPGMIVPIGLAVGLTEKNIDSMARAAHGLPATSPSNTLFLGSGINENHLESYLSTVSFRRSLRLGFGAGLRFRPTDTVSTEFNLGFSYSQIAHIYRETLALNSASADMRVTFVDRFFLGGGIFLGTLMDATWRSSAEVDGVTNPEAGFERVFTLAENMGFEAHFGIHMGQSRFVIGYNMNRGLSMGHGIETMSEAQIITLQPGSSIGDNLFQTGGLFTKIVIRW